MKSVRVPHFLRITLVYALLAVLWIIFFDSALSGLMLDAQALAVARSLKEWVPALAAVLVLLVHLGYEHRQQEKAASEHARATISLQKSAERYHALATVSPVGIVYTDEHGQYVDINERASEIVGVPAEQARNKKWTRILHPDDRDRVVKWWESSFSKGQSFNSEFRIIRPDGNVVWLACQALAQRDEKGRLQGYIGTIADVTRRKEIEEELDALAAELEQQARMLDQVLSTTPDQFLMYDRQGRYLYANLPALLAMDAESEEIIGKTWQEIGISPEQKTRFEVQFETVFTTGQAVISEYQLPVDEELRTFEMILSPISDAAGKIVAAVNTTRDITERKQAEAKLRYYAEIVESVSDAIISTDADGIIRSWNKAAETIYGWTDDEVRGKQIADLLSRFDPTDQAVVSQEYTTQEHWRGELPHQRKDGTPITIRTSVSVLRDAQGKSSGLVMINRNITEAKRAEQAIKDSERRYRLLFEKNPHPMWVVANDTLAFLAVNDAAIQHYGYSQAEFLDMTVKDIQRAQCASGLQSKTNGTDTPASEQEVWKHCKKDGSSIEVEVTSSPIDFMGQPAKLTLANDITARKRTEEEIKRRSQELAALLNVSNLLAQQLDRDVILEILVHAVKDLLPAATAASLWLFDDQQDKLVASAWSGFKDSVVKGLAISPEAGLVGKIYRTRRPQNIDDVAADPEFVSLPDVEQIRSTLGVPLITEQQVIGVLFADSISHAHAFNHSDLRLLEALGGQAAVAIHNVRLYEQVQQELAERRRAEHAQRESEERFRRLAQNAPDMIFRWSYKSGFEYVSPASLEVTGYTPEEYYADPGLHYRTVHPDDIPVYDSIFSELADPESPRKYSIVRVFHKDSHVVHIEMRLTPIYDGRGQLIAMEGIARDVSQHIIANARLRELSTRLTQAQEEERRRVAIELHDEVGQSLTVTKMRLKMLASGLPPEAEAAREQLKTLGGLVDESLQTVRSLSHQLRPPLLDEMGWQPAVEWLCDGFARRAQMPIEYKHRGPKARLDPGIELAAYRVVQEALTNVLRHANASQAKVSSSMNSTRLKITIKDSGQGFDVNALRNTNKPDVGLGLLSMQERVDINGGQLHIESKPGKGTSVTASFPVIYRSDKHDADINPAG